jgi:hypothetical protein
VDMRHLKSLGLTFVLFSVVSPLLSGQQPEAPPPHCAQILFCPFNQEALASDPAGIHKYSEDLIGNLIELIVPSEAGGAEIEPLVNRLAQAEQLARTGKAKLVPEADVVRAFNELMEKIGAPSSLRADEAAMRRFREHAAAIKAFPELFSGDRNGTNCNPGEAVFLFSLLMSDDGVLYEKSLDSAQALTHMNFKQNGGGPSFGVVSIESMGSITSRLLSSYSSRHNQNATIALLNHMTDALGL